MSIKVSMKRTSGSRGSFEFWAFTISSDDRGTLNAIFKERDKINSYCKSNVVGYLMGHEEVMRSNLLDWKKVQGGLEVSYGFEDKSGTMQSLLRELRDQLPGICAKFAGPQRGESKAGAKPRP